jgi:excisionase family DNA binding protein
VLEAASLLHVHPNTVIDLINAGAFPAAKVGRAWLMMTRDVLAYAEKVIIEQTGARLVGRRTRRRLVKGPR